MKSGFNCPVCAGTKWQSVEQYKLIRNGAAKHSVWQQRLSNLFLLFRILTLYRPARFPLSQYNLSDYCLRRRRVYFDIWHGPATFESICCSTCGFICYTPRPTADEIKAKYMFLEKHDPDDGHYEADPQKEQLERQRSEKVYETLAPHLSGDRVLDFGGGNGIILAAFQKRGLTCHLADFTDRQLPGIKKVADSIDDLKGAYDCIILSHVLEHVAEPGELLSSLRNHLNDTGLLYVEVPVEIAGGVRLEVDPVTHINFFTDGSLKTILQTNGYKIVHAFRGKGSFGRHQKEVAYAVALKGREKPAFEPQITNALLRPGRIDFIKQLWQILRKKWQNKSAKTAKLPHE